MLRTVFWRLSPYLCANVFVFRGGCGNTPRAVLAADATARESMCAGLDLDPWAGGVPPAMEINRGDQTALPLQQM